METGESTNGRANREQSTLSSHYGGQVFRQKQWHRAEKSAVHHLGDSVETDSNYAPSGGKTRDLQRDIRQHMSKDISEMDTLPLGATLAALKSSPGPTSMIVLRSSPPPISSTPHRSMTPSSVADISERRKATSDKPVHLIDFGEGDQAEGPGLSHFSSSGSSSPPNISGSAAALVRRRLISPPPPRQSPTILSPLPPPPPIGFRPPSAYDSRPHSRPSLQTSPEQSRESLLTLETRDYGVQVGDSFDSPAFQPRQQRAEHDDDDGEHVPLRRRSHLSDDEDDEGDDEASRNLQVLEMKSTSV